MKIFDDGEEFALFEEDTCFLSWVKWVILK